MKTLSRIIYFYPIIKKSGLFFIGVNILSFFPLIVAAQTAPNDTLSGIVQNIIDLAEILITIVFVLSILAFGWGIFQYVTTAGDGAKEGKARGIMTWGVIGMAVGVSLFGLIRFLQSYFGILPGAGPGFIVPTVNP